MGEQLIASAAALVAEVTVPGSGTLTGLAVKTALLAFRKRIDANDSSAYAEITPRARVEWSDGSALVERLDGAPGRPCWASFVDEDYALYGRTIDSRLGLRLKRDEVYRFQSKNWRVEMYVVGARIGLLRKKVALGKVSRYRVHQSSAGAAFLEIEDFNFDQNGLMTKVQSFKVTVKNVAWGFDVFIEKNNARHGSFQVGKRQYNNHDEVIEAIMTSRPIEVLNPNLQSFLEKRKPTPVVLADAVIHGVKKSSILC